LGKASSEFQRARIDAKKTLETDRYSSSTSKSLDREKLESIAETLGVDYSNKNDQDLRQAIESELKKQNTE
jgi:sec-independent protein translocase protein TatA